VVRLSEPEIDVKLMVDGKEIPMNPYVQKVFGAVIRSLISTLKGVDENWNHVEVQLDR
jgi:hypothetical protein